MIISRLLNTSDTPPSKEQLQFDPSPSPTGNEEIRPLPSDLLNKQVATASNNTPKKRRKIKHWTEEERNALQQIIQKNPTSLHREIVQLFKDVFPQRTKDSIRGYIKDQGWLTLKQQAESNTTPSPTGNGEIRPLPKDLLNKQVATASNNTPKVKRCQRWTKKEDKTLKKIIQNNPTLRCYEIAKLAQDAFPQRGEDSILSYLRSRKLIAPTRNIQKWTEEESNTLKQIIKNNPGITKAVKIARLAQGSLQRTDKAIKTQIYHHKLMDQ